MGRYTGELRLNIEGEAARNIWQLRAAVVFTPQGKIDGIVAIFTDITAWREAETEMRLAASVFQSTDEAIMVTDTDGVILSVNPAFTQITGFSADEAVGATPRILKSDCHDKDFFAGMWQAIIETGTWHGEVWNRGKNGDLFLKRGAISMIPDTAGKPSRYVSVFNDYTNIWNKNKETRHLAFHDALTGLANRALLQERLAQAVVFAGREGLQLLLIFIDLDGFKQVNDTFGHGAGDQLLKIVSERLKTLVRATDTVARLGGDEFVLLLEKVPLQQHDFAQTAERVVALIGCPMNIDGQTIQVGASVGLAVFPKDSQDPATLMKNADAAMYTAKTAGKNTFRFFNPGMTKDETTPHTNETGFP